MTHAPGPSEGNVGRYALFGEIASGGMATVHIGRLIGPAGFSRTVAIKRLHPQFAKDPDFVAMFLDEAHLAARIRHPNVVPTLDVVQSGDQLFLVMEYVAGETLSRILRATRAKGGLVPPRIACAILVGVLHGLHAAHEAKNEFGEPLNIVHRDVSPQNVIVGTDGVPRVLDFGVAKAIGRLQATQENQLKGKAAYMAPEQIRGGGVTRKTDIFAATIVLWEALTARRLFEADNQALVMQKVLSDKVPPPSSIVPDLPPELDEVVRRGLDRDPAKRYATAREMALVIEKALPLAMGSEIGEWVEAVAGDAIAMRAATIREIESSTANKVPPQIISSAEFIADALWKDAATTADPPREEAQPKTRQEGAGGTAVMPAKGASAPARFPPTTESPRYDDKFSSRPGRPEVPIEIAVAPARAVALSAEPNPWVRRIQVLGARVGVALLVLAVAFFIAMLALPGYVKGRAVALAAAEGMTLAIDNVSVGLGGIRIYGATATIGELPGSSVTAAELDVEMSWFEPKLVTARGVAINLDGPFLLVMSAVDRWYAQHHGAAGAGAASQEGSWLKVAVPSGRLAWTRAFGEEGRLDAVDVSGEIAPVNSPRLGDEFHFTTLKLTLSQRSDAAALAIGPWRVDVDRQTNGSRVRLAFDPPVPDGPNALLVRSTTGTVALDVTIPKAPLYRLGVPPVMATLAPEMPAQLEAKLHYALASAERAEGSFSVALYGSRLPPSAMPVDLKVAGSFGGDPRAPYDLRDGTLSAGAARATLTGSLTITDDLLRSNLAWKAAPIACAQMAPGSAGQAVADLKNPFGDVGDLNAELGAMGLDVGALAQAAGVAHISGTLNASGTITVDTSATPKTSFTVVSKNTCGLAFLKSK